MEFNGCKIRKSGKDFFKVTYSDGRIAGMRVQSIEAAQAMVLSQGRTMTRKEWSLVYNRPMPSTPTKEQAESEAMVLAGLVKGMI